MAFAEERPVKKTILVIDDTVKILNIVKFFLEEEGYKVETAADPLDGIAIAQKGGIDLIVLDIMMPRMDGYQVYRLLKKDAATRDIPVIMLTAKVVIMSTPKDFFYGLYGFLSKPFTKKKLVDTVNGIFHLTGSEAPDAARESP